MLRALSVLRTLHLGYGRLRRATSSPVGEVGTATVSKRNHAVSRSHELALLDR